MTQFLKRYAAALLGAICQFYPYSSPLTPLGIAVGISKPEKREAGLRLLARFLQFSPLASRDLRPDVRYSPTPNEDQMENGFLDFPPLISYNPSGPKVLVFRKD